MQHACLRPLVDLTLPQPCISHTLIARQNILEEMQTYDLLKRYVSKWHSELLQVNLHPVWKAKENKITSRESTVMMIEGG